MRGFRLRTPLTAEQRLRSNARAYVRVYLSRGKISRGKCLFCDEIGTEPHHEDYSKPLDVIWLCKFHHLALHGKIMRRKGRVFSRLHRHPPTAKTASV